VTQFEKIGTFAVRLIAVVSIGMGVVGLVFYALAAAMGTHLSPELSQRTGGGVWWVIFGVVFFVLSQPLGRLLGRGLE
jgi:hypothetical protein